MRHEVRCATERATVVRDAPHGGAAGDRGRGQRRCPPGAGRAPPNDDGAKQKVSQLVADGGLQPIDVGPLGRAQQLEQLGFLHIPSSSRAASASGARSSSIRDTPPRRSDGAEMSKEQALARFEPDIRPLYRWEDLIDAGSAS